jgi:hypothetical protein
VTFRLLPSIATRREPPSSSRITGREDRLIVANLPRWRSTGHHAIDVHVGVRVPQRRKMLELSQTRLGAALGLTL